MQLFIPKVIRKKRNGQSLKADEIRALITLYTAGKVPDYQMSAMLMAIYFRGLNPEELTAWTDAMLHSGSVLDLESVAGIKVDKHSTGGVGDKISLCLAPAVAAAGVPVPMISGRGLGHTGGTLDKLESISGFNIALSMDESRQLLDKYGLFLIGQTAELAPADRMLYALRDVTATVESIPLISSSIMSKKLAEGLDALVLDVKVGEGAFMKNLSDAQKLADTLIGIGQRAGKTVKALLTNMDQPIGAAVGNSLEMKEAIEVMKGKGPEDTIQLTVELGAQMVVLGGKASSLEQGRDLIQQKLNDGSALELFAKVIEAQGGNPEVCDDPNLLPKAGATSIITAIEDGYVNVVKPLKVAQAALEVNAGRRVKEDSIDPATGVVLLAKVGDQVLKGKPLAQLHHNNNGNQNALKILNEAFVLGPKIRKPSLIIERR